MFTGVMCFNILEIIPSPLLKSSEVNKKLGIEGRCEISLTLGVGSLGNERRDRCLQPHCQLSSAGGRRCFPWYHTHVPSYEIPIDTEKDLSQHYLVITWDLLVDMYVCRLFHRYNDPVHSKQPSSQIVMLLYRPACQTSNLHHWGG